MDTEDGTQDGRVDIDSLVDAVGTDSIVEFFSSSGQSFTIEPGLDTNDYFITLADGTVIVTNGTRQGRTIGLGDLDAENQAVDGRVDIDALLDGDSSDNIVSFTGGVPCLCAGTRVATKNGVVLVEDLQIGDLVKTRDSGFQPVQWIGMKQIDKIDLAMNPKLYPVAIKAGALGDTMPDQDMLVSRQHRILVRSTIAQRIFATNEILAPAISLVELDGFNVEKEIEGIEYFHILFEKHEIILANNLWTESLLLGPQAMTTLSASSIEEIKTLFPEIAIENFESQPARMVPHTKQIREQLAARHRKNSKPLFS